MKTFTKILYVVVTLGFLGIFSQANAQCAFNNDPYLSTSAPTTVGQTVTATTCIWGGEYRTFTNMVAGSTYRIETCGDTDFNTELTIFASGNTSSPLAYNDDFCGSQSSIDFVPSSSGDYFVQVNEVSCQTNTTCMTLRITLVNAAPPQPVACPSILPIPYSQDFESFGSNCSGSCTTPCPLTAGWTNETGDAGDWILDSGGTSSSSTGPSTDFNPGTSTGKYLYTEASGCSNADRILTTPCFLLAGALCPAATFAYHQYGQTQGTLDFEISTDQGTTWTTLWTSTGDQGNVWLGANVDLTAYSGQIVRFRFVGTTGSSFYSDMAIDDFGISDQFGSLNASFTGLPSTIAVNAGSVNLTPASPGGTFSGPGMSGVTFDPFVAGIGTHTITYTVGSGFCAQTSSQNVTVTPIVCNATNSLPYSEDFDSFSSCTGSCGSACTLSNGWTNEVIGDDFDWTTDANGTSSSSTGPSGDNTSGSGNYLYTETSGTACENATAIATSPCVNLSGASCPVLTFAYHMYGADQGTFNVDISSDNGNTWSNLFSATGDLGDQWNYAIIDLSAYSGVIRLRMRGETGGGFESDMAFDDVAVYDFSGADASFTGLGSTACTSDGSYTLVPATPGGTFSGPGVSGNVFDAAGVGAGTYTITYSVGPAACASSSSQTVTVLPPPTVSVSGNNELCDGESTSLTASSGSCPGGFDAIYSANSNNEITLTAQTFNISFANTPTPTGDGTLTFQVRGDYGLTSELTTLFDENGNQLAVNAGPNTTSDCAGYGVVTLTVPQATLAGWAADNTIEFTAVNSSSVNSLCTDEDVDITITYPFGAITGCQVSWSDDQGNSLGSTASINVTPNGSTTYTATVTDANGCSTSEDYLVTVHPLPFVDAGADQEICDGETATLTVNGGSGGGSGTNSLTTTFADNNSSGGNMFDIVATTTVEITGLDANFTSTGTNDVAIYYKSGSYQGFETNASAWTLAGTATVTGLGRGIATPVPIPLSVNIPAGQTYSFFLHVTSGGIAYTNGTTEGVPFVSDGNITVLEGIGRSTSTTPFTSTVFSPRVVNTNVHYNVGGSTPTGVTYLWSTGETTQSIDVTPAVGTSTYSVTITDANGCSNSDEVDVLVNPNPTFTHTVTNVSCFGGSDGAIDLNIAGQSLGAPVNATQMQNLTSTGQALTFTFAGVTPPTGAATLTIRKKGDFDLSTEYLEIFDENSVLIGQTTPGGVFAYQCDSILTDVFTIPLADIAGYAADGSVTFVADATSSVNILSCAGGEWVEMTLSYPGGPSFTASWTGPNGYTSSDEDISGLVAGDYTVTVTDAVTGCNTTETITVSEPPLLVAEAGDCGVVFPGYSGGGADLCEELMGSATGGTAPYSYSWSSGDNSANSTVCPNTTTLYTLTVTDANGCVATDTVRVYAYDVTATCSNGGTKIEICHVPPGNPGNAQTICVGPAAGEAHLVGSSAGGHDNCYLGPCGYDPCAGSAKGFAAEGMNVVVSVNAYPNPFSTSTTIQFSASAADVVTLEVFTLKGEKVASLYNGKVEAKVVNTVKFHSSDLSDGIYMYKLTTQSGEQFIDKLVISR